jgi:hypothetical protein
MTTTLATDRGAHTATPVLPTADAHLTLRPLPTGDARITGGFWALRQEGAPPAPPRPRRRPQRLPAARDGRQLPQPPHRRGTRGG